MPLSEFPPWVLNHIYSMLVSRIAFQSEKCVIGLLSDFVDLVLIRGRSRQQKRYQYDWTPQVDSPYRLSSFFAAHLNHLEHFLYKAGYIHVSYCCQAFGFSVSFAKVLATIYMCLYISYLIFSLNHKEYLLPVSSFRKALITHYVFGMQCFATVYILSDLFYLLTWNISILNTLDNVSSFLLSVRML